MSIYIPILKLKRGEVYGISQLMENSKKSVLPLFVAPPPPFDPETDEPLKTVSDMLKEFEALLKQYWEGHSCLMDLWFYDNSRSFFLSDPKAVQAFFNKNTFATPCIPVFDPEQTDDEAVELTKIDSKCYIRVLCNKMPDEDKVDSLITRTMGSRATPAGILLDLGYVSADTFSDKRRTAKLFLAEINERNCPKAIAATSFPPSKEVPSGRYEIHRFPRLEQALWTSVNKKDSLIFSDYTAVNPEYREFDPRTMSLGGKIRYTLDKEFIIAKGESIKNGGSEQFQVLADMVSHCPGFRGNTFSWGDNVISKCASGEGTLGNQETWVRVAVNQHIQFILDQI